MKNTILLIILLVISFLILGKLTNFSEREKAHNKYMCAVYGYYEDCKTPLKEEDKLK